MSAMGVGFVCSWKCLFKGGFSRIEGSAMKTTKQETSYLIFFFYGGCARESASQRHNDV